MKPCHIAWNQNECDVSLLLVQVGVCEEITINACQSLGAGGRPLQFSFSVASDTVVRSELLAALPQNTAQCSFTIGRGALDPGSSYNFTVSARNYLNLAASAQVCRQCPALALSGIFQCNVLPRTKLDLLVVLIILYLF